MNDVQLLELIAETDLYGFDSPLPGSTWSRAVAFREIERRIGMDTRDTMRESQRTDEAATGSAAPGGPRRRWSAAWVAALAFVVVLGIVGAVIAAVSLSGDEDVAGGTADTFGPEAAVQIAEAWFAAGLEGDGERALALLTPELRARAGVELERSIAFNAAVLVTSTPPDCTGAGDGPRVVVVVGCKADASSALDRAVGAPGTRLTTALTVTPEGIDDLSESVDVSPAIVLGPFLGWMSEAHPEESGTLEGIGEEISVAAAQAAGETIVRYADEYAAYLAETGCAYDVPCDAFGIEQALARADAYFAAYEIGDVDAAIALLTPELRVTVGDQFERVHRYITAADFTFTEPECSASGDAVPVAIECTYEQLPYLNAVVGAPSIVMTATMTVTPDGIATLYETSDTGPQDVLFFMERWMAEAHPEAAAMLGVFMQWPSAEEAVASGATVVEYAGEYAAYLAASGCTYNRVCQP